MTPMLTHESPATRNPDELIDLLTPEDPALQREMASFHAAALVRHLITLVAEGHARDQSWRADVQSSIAAMAEVLG